MYHAIYWCTKANNKYMKLCHPNKESSYLVYWHVNNLYGWTMSQKLAVDDFEWRKDVFRFDKDNNKACILEIKVDYPKNYRKKHNDFPCVSNSKYFEEGNRSCSAKKHGLNHT